MCIVESMYNVQSYKAEIPTWNNLENITLSDRKKNVA